MPEIKIKGLTKSYNGAPALDSLDLEISPGEIMGILGPNGAGKTTLISILSTTIAPSGGSVKMAGADVTAAPEKVKPIVGIVPQEVSLYNDLTIEENIVFFSRMYGVSGKTLTEKTDRLISFAGLEARRADPVKTLSGGMKRRLNFVCGLANSPRIVLLDEPTVGVDPQSREHIYEMVRKLRREGVTTSSQLITSSRRKHSVTGLRLWTGERFLWSTPFRSTWSFSEKSSGLTGSTWKRYSFT